MYHVCPKYANDNDTMTVREYLRGNPTWFYGELINWNKLSTRRKIANTICIYVHFRRNLTCIDSNTRCEQICFEYIVKSCFWIMLHMVYCSQLLYIVLMCALTAIFLSLLFPYLIPTILIASDLWIYKQVYRVEFHCLTDFSVRLSFTYTYAHYSHPKRF